MRAYAVSRYNFSVRVEDRTLLFNARTGALIALDGPHAEFLASCLVEYPAQLRLDNLPEDTAALLLSGEFVGPPERDELLAIRREFEHARHATPFVLTLTTTMDCNLGCYYCYETRSTNHLEQADLSSIVALARAGLTRRPRQALHVDWYGGEPLLNVTFMDAAADALQRLCAELGCRYHASVISNGTCWPKDVGPFVERHHIRQVQITLDGLPARHNKRRTYRQGYAATESSFDAASDLITRLLDHVRVDLRVNIDSRNQSDVLPLLRLAKERGWFDKQWPLVVQPARLAAYSERVSFLRGRDLDFDRFDAIKADIRAFVSPERIEESEMPEGIPRPRSSVCAALAWDSVVVGADRQLYRCGLQVTEASRAIGHLRNDQPTVDSPAAWSDAQFWSTFDPTKVESCAKCSFLPMCWGGCPKQHLERDEWALFQQSLYWRRRLPPLIARAAGVPHVSPPAFSEHDQFRDCAHLRRTPATPRVDRQVIPLRAV